MHQLKSKNASCFEHLNFYSVLGYSQLTNNAVMVPGEQQRDSAISIHVSILRQMTLPTGLLHNFEQSSMKNASFLPQPVICGESYFRLTQFKHKNEIIQKIRLWQF